MADILKEQKAATRATSNAFTDRSGKGLSEGKKGLSSAAKTRQERKQRAFRGFKSVYRRLQQYLNFSIGFIFSHHLGCSSMKKQARQLISSAQSAQKHLVHSRQIWSSVERVSQNCTSFKSQALSGNDNLSAEMKSFVGQMDASVDAVLQKLQKDLEAQKFIQQFDTSLIVLVVGKVNVGKSSLGNLVSGDAFNKALGSDSPFKGLQMEFRRHQRANQTKQSKPEILTSKHFQEKETECTASIQEFTLVV